jgi:hypothetical protein
MNTSAEVYGRDVNVYIQFFDANFRPLDNPYVCWAGMMDVMHVKHNVDTCTIELTAESLFFRRSLAPLGILSDRDQNRFYPGDTGLSGDAYNGCEVCAVACHKSAAVADDLQNFHQERISPSI